jgi:hypothetical protein
MKRLRELEPDDRLMSRTHELIDAMGPTVPSEARLLRVRRALDQPVRRPLGVWAMRGALAFAVVAGGASALAFSGAFSSPAAPQEGARTSPSAPVAPRPRSVPPPPTTNRAEPSEDTAVPPREAATPRVRRSAPPGTPSSSNESDVARIHEAAKALRGDGDPERALRLLESSEKAGGPLAEEALALRIEAASAGGDPRAKSLARSYLSRYPSGRYRELARRTLATH